MAFKLFDHQKEAVEKLRTGNILQGDVGSGKSITALTYYFIKECGGYIDAGRYDRMTSPKDLYIITTARKRDTLDWEKECLPFLLTTHPEISIYDTKVIVDSWNNIGKYISIKNAFFIFDEQRVVGSGAWVKSFLKICKLNRWVLLSATPGDTWIDYIPVFVANGFYKNRTEFLRRHVVYKYFSNFPKIDHYVEVPLLVRLRDKITVQMRFQRNTIPHDKRVVVEYNRDLYHMIMVKRWHIYEDRPVKDVSELFYLIRRLVNSDPSRIEAIKEIVNNHHKIIVFYNFNYELELLLSLGKSLQIATTQWNGHKHEPIPTENYWMYLVQYTAGAEGWNCIETDTIVFFSQNYSYKAMVQAPGRIDRLNTPFTDLYYYHLRSTSSIDMAIQKALRNKQNFNERKFLEN